jgi:flavin-dependent dehydrogenase
MKGAEFEKDSFCSVAGFDLGAKRAGDWPECSIGDALTMTPPLTGNGMSMAFESAELALQPLVQYTEGRSSWDEACSRIARKCDERFTRRLQIAGWLQRALFRPRGCDALLWLTSRGTWIWSQLFAWTR